MCLADHLSLAHFALLTLKYLLIGILINDLADGQFRMSGWQMLFLFLLVFQWIDRIYLLRIFVFFDGVNIILLFCLHLFFHLVVYIWVSLVVFAHEGHLSVVDAWKHCHYGAVCAFWVLLVMWYCRLIIQELWRQRQQWALSARRFTTLFVLSASSDLEQIVIFILLRIPSPWSRLLL